MRARAALLAIALTTGCNELSGFSSLEKVDVGAGGSGGSPVGTGGAGAGDGGGGMDGGGNGPMPIQLNDLAVGRHGTCTTDELNNVKCWGAFPGDGRAEALRPVDVPGLSAVLSVKGRNHTCSFDDTSVFCWGRNDEGQLGLGNTESQLSPQEVTGLPVAIERMSSGGDHTCASSVDDPPRVFCWGANDWGQLGQGDMVTRLTPVEITPPGPVLRVACGVDYSCLLIDTGELYCFGRNDSGQLGLDPAMMLSVDVPTLVTGLPTLERVYPGNKQTCGRRQGDRRMFCWGGNDSGQLGDGTTTSRHTPVMIGEIDELAVAYPGISHTCAIDGTSVLFCWGSNAHGQLGAPLSTTMVSLPMTVATGIDAIASKTSEHVCYLGQDDLLRCLGLNDSGQLGVGTYANSNTAEPVLY